MARVWARIARSSTPGLVAIWLICAMAGLMGRLDASAAPVPVGSRAASPLVVTPTSHPGQVAGQDGRDGAPGRDGTPVTAEDIAAAVAAYCAERDECRGPAGVDGATGPMGPVGPVGPVGSSGTPGSDGATVTPDVESAIAAYCARTRCGGGAVMMAAAPLDPPMCPDGTDGAVVWLDARDDEHGPTDYRAFRLCSGD